MFKETSSRVKRKDRLKNGFYIVLKFIGTNILLCPVETGEEELISFSMNEGKYIGIPTNVRSIHLYPSCFIFSHLINDSLIPKT